MWSPQPFPQVSRTHQCQYNTDVAKNTYWQELHMWWSPNEFSASAGLGSQVAAGSRQPNRWRRIKGAKDEEISRRWRSKRSLLVCVCICSLHSRRQESLALTRVFKVERNNSFPFFYSFWWEMINIFHRSSERAHFKDWVHSDACRHFICFLPLVSPRLLRLWWPWGPFLMFSFF